MVVLRILAIAALLLAFDQVKAQNVGVGTTQPKSRLHVAGNIQTDSALVVKPILKAAANAISIGNRDGFVVITSVSGTQTNTITMTGTPKNGQLLSIYNRDDDDASFSSVIVKNGTMSQFSYYSGSWKAMSSRQKAIGDADDDTRVTTEATTDEDKVRVMIDGTVRWTFNEHSITPNFKSSLFMGGSAGSSITTGTYNTGIGPNTSASITTGSGNSAIGRNSLNSCTTGNYNSALGHNSLQSSTTGNQSVGIGNNSLYSVTTGEKNTALGALSGYSTTGNKNVFLGYKAGYWATGSNKLYIANSDDLSPLVYGDFSTDYLQINGTLNIRGSYSLPTSNGSSGQVLETDGSGGTSWQTPIADDQQVNTFSLSGSTLKLSLERDGQTDRTVNLSSINTDNQTVDKLSLSGSTLSLSLESDGASDYTVDLSSIDTDTDNQTVDKLSLSGTVLSLSLEDDGASDYTVDLSSIDTSSDTDDQSVDKFSLSGSTLSLSLEDDGASDYTVDLSSINSTNSLIADADNDTKIQMEETADEDKVRIDIAGTERWVFNKHNLESNYQNSLFIGEDAGDSISTGQYNTGIGQYALSGLTTGGYNSALGRYALGHSTSGHRNSAFGSAALWKCNGDDNSAFGSSALFQTTNGRRNSVFGRSVMYTNVGGDENVAMGYEAGYKMTGNKNTSLGTYAGYSSTGNGSVFLGHSAGYYETGSNKLYIDNSNTTSPLIYGDFSTNLLRVNGTLNINDVYSLPAADGTSGQVLQTNGSGTASWTTITGSDDQTVDVFSLSGSTLSLSLEDDGASNYTADLSSINTDNQTVDVFSLSGSTLSLSLEDDGVSTYTTNLSSINTDDQTVDKFSLSGTTLSLSLESDGQTDKTVDLSAIAGIQTLVADADNDTKIQVEETADEDKVRIDIAGTETWVFNDRNLAPNFKSSAFIGSGSGSAITTGTLNVGLGHQSLAAATTATSNVAIGYRSLYNNEVGTLNVAVGKEAGHGNLGSRNVFLGHRAGYYETGSEKLYIDNSTTSTPLIYGDFSSNQLTVNGLFISDGNVRPKVNNTYNCGSSSYKWKAVYATNGTIQTSDRRFKKNIIDMSYGLYELMALRSVTYQWKEDSLGETKLGFIAQELEQIVPEVVNIANDSMQTRGVNYSELIPVLVRAVQEQQQIIEDSKLKIENYEAKIEIAQEVNANQNQRLAELDAKLDILLGTQTVRK